MSLLFALHPHAPHAVPYFQHLLFDGIADGGGYWASRFCHHWYHRVAIAVAFALVTTLALVTLVG